MYRLHRSPLLLLFVFLALFALACGSFSIGQDDPAAATTAAPSEQQALVEQAVATVMAQLPAGATTAPSVAAPISTDLEATLIDLYRRVNPSVVQIYIYDEQSFEIGTGSGYQAAVLSPLVKEVYSIEIVLLVAALVAMIPLLRSTSHAAAGIRT